MDQSLAAFFTNLFGKKEVEQPSQSFEGPPSQSFEPSVPEKDETPIYNHSTLIAQLLAGQRPSSKEEDEDKFPTLKGLLKKYVGSI